MTPRVYMGMPSMATGFPPSGLDLDAHTFSSPMSHSVSETGVDGPAVLSPSQLRQLPMGTMPGPMTSPVPVTLPGAPLSSDGKRRRLSPPSFSSPVRPDPSSSPYGMMMPQSGPNGSMYFAPSMLSFNMPESPSPSSSADVSLQSQTIGANLSPLAHRTVLRTASVSGTSPTSLPGPSYHESPVMRRANSYGGVSAPWPTRDQMGFFHGPPGLSSPPTASPSMGPPMSAPLMMQRQNSSPQPRASRERSTRPSTTDVWPDDVEVAFWEALRLIPKLGRRKVLVHGKPCGRNELIADYIERKTGKLRSRKQVSSHIQVLKNVKRGDLEFQQLIAEPTSEEDYYTPAGGMMYAHTLAEYSMGLLGFSLAPSSADVLPSPLLSSTPAVGSPLPPGHSPAQSPATGLISRALDNMHMSSPSPNPAARTLPPTGVRQTSPAQWVPLYDVDPLPTFIPTAFSLWAYSSKSDDRHTYTNMDTLAMSQLLQMGGEVPVLPSNGPTATSFRFPHLTEMHRHMACPFVHVHVPLTLPRAEPSAPMYDRLGVALSMGSTQNAPLSVVLSIYSHGKCVLTLVERLEAPRPLARGRSDSRNAASTDEASTLPRSPAPGDARYAWAYQVPFATDFWADFLSRNHSQRLFQSPGASIDNSYCKEPSERASVGMAVAGVAFVQEFVVPHKDAPHGPQTGSPAVSDSGTSPGSRLGDVVGVLAWEFECIESSSREPGKPRVSVLGPPLSPGSATTTALQTPHRAAAPAMTPTPASPTLGVTARTDTNDKGLLGLQLQPKSSAPSVPLSLGAPPRGGEVMGRTVSMPATSGSTQAPPTHPSVPAPPDVHLLRPTTTPPPMPTLVHTQASPLAVSDPVKVDEGGTMGSAGAPPAEQVALPGQDAHTSPLKPSSHFLLPSRPQTSLGLGSDLYPSSQFAPGMSTLSPAMVTADWLAPQGLGLMPTSVAPQRSHSMSVLHEQDSDLMAPSSTPLPSSLSALSDSMPSHLDTADANGRWATSHLMSWNGQQDLMDAFLDSSMMESTHISPGSPTTTPSFSQEPSQAATASASDRPSRS